jgi:hypothetical protein
MDWLLGVKERQVNKQVHGFKPIEDDSGTIPEMVMVKKLDRGRS